jgi:signal transduction histidine kinase
MAGHAPDEMFALLLERACDLLNTSQAAIWEVDRAEPEHLVLCAAFGEMPAGYRVPVQGSLLGRAVFTRQPVVSARLEDDARLSRRDLAQRMGWESALIVPLLMRDGTPRGALGVYARETRGFSDWDVRLLTCLANHAAVALQLAEALDQVKLAEERHAVAETFAVLGDISANLLHRVNNLIGVIPVKVQTLAAKRPALMHDDYVAARLSEIEAGARGAMEVARETVTYLRPVRLQPTWVHACVAQVIVRLPLPATVQLTVEGLEALPPVLAGDEPLRLAFFNLFENALDSLGERPGVITVTGRVAADGLDPARSWAEITIADDGPGVPLEARERIFEPDFSTKHSGKKLGFGLWWVKTWVQRCGGSIGLLTPSGATGCIFRLRLPLAGPDVKGTADA